MVRFWVLSRTGECAVRDAGGVAFSVTVMRISSFRRSHLDELRVFRNANGCYEGSIAVVCQLRSDKREIVFSTDVGLKSVLLYTVSCDIRTVAGPPTHPTSHIHISGNRSLFHFSRPIFLFFQSHLPSSRIPTNPWKWCSRFAPQQAPFNDLWRLLAAPCRRAKAPSKYRPP